MAESKVDIRGIDKVQLLYLLWSSQKVANFFTFNNIKPLPFDHEAAEKEVKTYIDYFCGRCIKTDLSKGYADSRLYNQDAGDHKFEDIVKYMKEK